MIKMKLSVNSRLQVTKYSCQEHAIGYEIYVENYYKFHITIYTNGIMVTSRWRSLKACNETGYCSRLERRGHE